MELSSAPRVLVFSSLSSFIFSCLSSFIFSLVFHLLLSLIFHLLSRLSSLIFHLLFSLVFHVLFSLVFHLLLSLVLYSCLRVLLCVWLWLCVCGVVWCGVVRCGAVWCVPWHAEPPHLPPVCPFKTSPCVPAPRAPKSKHCFLLFQFANRSRTTCCRFLRSFALPEGNKLSGMQRTICTSVSLRKSHCHGYSCRLPALVLNFSPTTLTFRALHGNHIVSTPFQTIVRR